MLRITFEELEKNLDYYLEKSNEEDIYITKNGELISALISPNSELYSAYKKFRDNLCQCLFQNAKENRP